MRVKDWQKFQHFKNRRPPWIKLYRDILDDPDWHDLDPFDSKVLVMLWLLASEYDGALPCMRKVAFRLRLPEDQILSAISRLSHWITQDDITAISGGYQDDTPEGETEGETEGEKSPAQSKIAPCPYDEIIEAYHRNLPALPQVFKLTPARKKAVQARWREDPAHREPDFWDAFFQQAASQPFLLGDNQRGWKADFEWLMKQGNFWKVVEGKYKEAA